MVDSADRDDAGTASSRFSLTDSSFLSVFGTSLSSTEGDGRGDADRDEVGDDITEGEDARADCLSLSDLVVSPVRPVSSTSLPLPVLPPSSSEVLVALGLTERARADACSPSLSRGVLFTLPEETDDRLLLGCGLGAPTSGDLFASSCSELLIGSGGTWADVGSADSSEPFSTPSISFSDPWGTFPLFSLISAASSSSSNFSESYSSSPSPSSFSRSSSTSLIVETLPSSVSE
mmetsp:Transcript_48627/g.126148  ORF Transcript_48627/g.126148 Transcript_48627/m.126148 type:complete len:233 (-) Transcript_48627:389-1087(-)